MCKVAVRPTEIIRRLPNTGQKTSRRMGMGNSGLMSAKRWSKSRKSLSHTKRGSRHRKSRRQSQTGESIISKIFRNRRKGKRAKKQITPRVITGWRLWLFRIIALAVFPVLLLVVLELSLRIVGYGFFPKAIVTFQADGKDACCDNVKAVYQDQTGWQSGVHRHGC